MRAHPELVKTLHERARFVASALGTPPADMIKHIHEEGRVVAALCGSPYQARKHADAGVDIIIAQGGEGGGHLRSPGVVDADDLDTGPCGQEDLQSRRRGFRRCRGRNGARRRPTARRSSAPSGPSARA